MNPDQTSLKEEVRSGSILFAIYANKIHMQIREKTMA